VAEEEAPALQIDGLTVTYFGRDQAALRDVSIELTAGSVVGVAGANGAGKSTLALAAAGFIPRIVRAMVNGEVRVAGEPLVAADPARLTGLGTHQVGIVFPNPANQMSATKTSVREELAFGLENLGIDPREMDGRIDDVLDRLRIRHLADRTPFGLSGGEQQRVAIASVVAMGSRVLVLDEPTAQLDPGSTVAVGALLDDLAAAGTAILVAEHAAEILAGTSRCLVLVRGEVVAAGHPGAALASSAALAGGVRPPTLVTLAMAAGLGFESAFDEAAIATALRGGDVAVRSGSAVMASEPAPMSWQPVRAPRPASVSVQGLVHRYPGGVEALAGVDLDVEHGETVAVIGQNGSGKTTLVKHLNGLLRPDAGSVTIDGADIRSSFVHELAAVVGFVFQNPDDQLFNRSVERELLFGPRNLRLPSDEIEALVAQALAAIGLDGDRSTNPYDLNVSSRKLVALGSVLAMDPQVLVLDEPTTGQDGPGVRRVGAIVDALAAAGRTVIAITHDMEFAARHFDRIVVMRRGQVVLDGAAGEVVGAANEAVLESTGLARPPAARIASRLGLDAVPPDAQSLLRLLGRA
jgi:energy-coupling factor transporter ATP-binding protein EcfA2